MRRQLDEELRRHHRNARFIDGKVWVKQSRKTIEARAGPVNLFYERYMHSITTTLNFGPVMALITSVRPLPHQAKWS